ncbi:hypothetical protein D6C97_08704 [Aureobasidium pullulans]|uniref:Uncharacterized protein n=1 Tax=Aureobasidium pullulans TaxID=5580 RepID=A0AB74JGX3_AURPU|nr:hypothetical protein D6D12_09077 [Aureobasidium pullulans]THX46753.1 hypothetical protein D6D08_10249 [Aureobasidium pullulans]THY45152.1 hypothetical protein D6C97_08704 [Aureobasidium pullulans]
MPPSLPLVDKGASTATTSASLPSPKPSNTRAMPTSPSTELAANLNDPAAIDPPSSAMQKSWTANLPVQVTYTPMTPNNPLGLLGRLPRELRDMMYAYAVDPPTKDDFSGEPDDYYRDITRRRPIMQTCKGMRLECLESYLAENEIDCTYNGLSPYRLFEALSKILARPYFRAQGYSMNIELPRQDYLQILLTCESLRAYDRTLHVFLECYRLLETSTLSIPFKNLFVQLKHRIRIYSMDNVAAQWRTIEPNGDKISIKLWANDRQKSSDEVLKVCSQLKNCVLQSSQQPTDQDQSIALITGLEKYNMAIIEAMMLWWQDADAKDEKTKQELKIKEEKRKQEHEDRLQKIWTNHSKSVEEIELACKRDIQKIEGMDETKGRSSKRRRLD